MIEQIFGIARLLLNAWVAILKRSNLDRFKKKTYKVSLNVTKELTTLRLLL